ncbi:MAG TPA: LCP family protein [Actinopolymorphaceae bacterium]
MRRPRLRIGRVLLLAVLAYVVFLIAVPIISWNKVERVDFTPAGGRPADSPGTTYLVVGSDRRDDLTPEQQAELGTGDASGSRTDTIMLLHVPSNGLPPTLVSIPRDSLLPIPDRGRHKVNSAFSWGGPKLLAETLEDATDLRVDAYVEVGFGGFAGMVDAVGGVDMCLDEAMKDRRAHIDLPAGCQTLDGKNALGYVRARYSDPRGDLGRVERQQEFLAALAGKAMSPGTLVNPVRYAGFGFATGDSIVAGEDTSIVDMARFALAMRAVSGGVGQSMTVPLGRVGNSVSWDEEDAGKLFGALRNDDPIPPSLLPDSGD